MARRPQQVTPSRRIRASTILLLPPKKASFAHQKIHPPPPRNNRICFENNKRWRGAINSFAPLNSTGTRSSTFIQDLLVSRGLINSLPERERKGSGRRGRRGRKKAFIIIIIIEGRGGWKIAFGGGLGHFRSSVKFPASAHCSATIVLVSRGRRFPLSPPFVRFRGRISRLFARARDGVQGRRGKEEDGEDEIKGWKRRGGARCWCARACVSNEKLCHPPLILSRPLFLPVIRGANTSEKLLIKSAEFSPPGSLLSRGIF